MRREGESHNIAELLATQRVPHLTTDASFLQGHCNGSQFAVNPILGDRYRDDAKAKGVDTTGKVYMHALADFPGDPRAWVSGRGDVQKVCEERGWGCSGAVNVKRRFETRKAEAAPVADDIVARHVEEEIQAHPEPQALDREEVTEKVRKKLTPKWGKK